MEGKQNVLITGAAGYIGSFLRKAWTGRYNLWLVDHKDITDADGAETLFGDIRDYESMKRACDGMDTVVHLAANPSSRSEFDTTVLPMNIIGTHSVFKAASDMGVKRVVFASSIHAVGGYPPDIQVKWDMPVRPCCEYGASKCYGEALGRYFSDMKRMSVIAVRIGGVHGHEGHEPHHDPNMLDILVSEEDMVQLMTKCVDAPLSLRFAIIHGISDNRIKRLDISHTREILGYDPVDEVGKEIKSGVPDTTPLYH